MTHISEKESGVPSIGSAEGLFQYFQGRLLRAASLQAFSQHKIASDSSEVKRGMRVPMTYLPGHYVFSHILNL